MAKHWTTKERAEARRLTDIGLNSVEVGEKLGRSPGSVRNQLNRQSKKEQITPELERRLQEQKDHPLYKNAYTKFKRVQSAQREKAARKYPEPLNPAVWGAQKLIQHAFEELVDQAHYLTAIEEVTKALQKENDALKEENKRIRELLDDEYERRNKEAKANEFE